MFSAQNGNAVKTHEKTIRLIILSRHSANLEHAIGYFEISVRYLKVRVI